MKGRIAYRFTAGYRKAEADSRLLEKMIDGTGRRLGWLQIVKFPGSQNTSGTENKRVRFLGLAAEAVYHYGLGSWLDKSENKL